MRLEKRHNYVRKVAETATQMFITNDKVNVAGIVLAGSADFKNDLAQSDIFDQRLVAKVLTLTLALTLALTRALTRTLTLTLTLTLTRWHKDVDTWYKRLWLTFQGSHTLLAGLLYRGTVG